MIALVSEITIGSQPVELVSNLTSIIGNVCAFLFVWSGLGLFYLKSRGGGGGGGGGES